MRQGTAVTQAALTTGRSRLVDGPCSGVCHRQPRPPHMSRGTVPCSLPQSQGPEPGSDIFQNSLQQSSRFEFIRDVRREGVVYKMRRAEIWILAPLAVVGRWGLCSGLQIRQTARLFAACGCRLWRLYDSFRLLKACRESRSWRHPPELYLQLSQGLR